MKRPNYKEKQKVGYSQKYERRIINDEMKRAKIKNKNKKGYVDIEKMGLRPILKSQRVLWVLKRLTCIMLIDINRL